MKRLILFRGKRIDNGEWVYGDLRSYLGGGHTFIQKGFNMKEVIPETVGQYTGQDDVDGVKIFDGDIISHYQDVENEVYWANDLGGWFFCNSHASALPLVPYSENIREEATPIRVIGNIHDKEIKKRSDISTRDVLLAYDNLHNGRGLSPLESLMKHYNAPEKVVWSAIERDSDRGLLDYGTSLNGAWLTDKGKEYLKKEIENENKNI